MFWNVKSKEVNNMEEESMEDILEALYRDLGKKTKALDKNKIESSTSGEGPNPTIILPQWSVSGKKVDKMKIEKRRRPGSGGNIEPMGL